MNLKEARLSGTSIAVPFGSKEELEVIRTILCRNNMREDYQYMPDERYSYVSIPTNGEFQLSTGIIREQKVSFTDFINSNK